jgi:VanZ family protein
VNIIKHPITRWLPALVWTGLIAWLSHQPTLPAPSIPHVDKVFHAGEYGMLALLWARAVFPILRRYQYGMRWGYVVLGCLLYAISDEMHQAFIPGRSCDPFDMIADMAGAVLAALVASILSRRLLRILSIEP